MDIYENTYSGGTLPVTGSRTIRIDNMPLDSVTQTSDTGNREKIRPVKAVLKTLACPIDGCDGEMQDGGMVLTSYPPFYQHFCTKCGHMEYINGKSYPYYDFVPVEEDTIIT